MSLRIECPGNSGECGRSIHTQLQLYLTVYIIVIILCRGCAGVELEPKEGRGGVMSENCRTYNIHDI